MDIKLALAVLSVVIGTIAYIPYVHGVLKGKTKPHVFTWFIWSLSLGTAAVGAWYGGGGYGALGLVVGTVFTFGIFLLSFKYGTKNITRVDVYALLASLLAIFLWWQFNNPYIAIALVTFVDALGYIPSMRKSFKEPWSEPLLSWCLFTITPLLSLFALTLYNFLTVTYLLMSVTANIMLLSILFIQRRHIPAPYTK